jgi:hypothetical protein
MPVNTLFSVKDGFHTVYLGNAGLVVYLCNVHFKTSLDYKTFGDIFSGSCRTAFDNITLTIGDGYFVSELIEHFLYLAFIFALGGGFGFAKIVYFVTFLGYLSA